MVWFGSRHRRGTGSRNLEGHVYNAVRKPGLSEEDKRVQRQAFAGMLWSRRRPHSSNEYFHEENGMGLGASHQN